MSGRQRIVLVTLLGTCVFFLVLARRHWSMPEFDFTAIRSNRNVSLPRQRCTNVIRKMLIGRWERHDITEMEKKNLYALYEKLLREKGIGYGFQRKDGRCGNVSQSWFRALCHPAGSTPCCFNSQCRNLTPQDCNCPNCYDLQKQIQPEFATWHPVEEACKPQKMAVRELCYLMNNATVYFIGDSLIRHLYVAFLMALKGNEDTGGHSRNMPPDVSAGCHGARTFILGQCRKWIDYDPSVCGNNVKVKFPLLRATNRAEVMHRRILELGNKTRALVVFGVGADDSNDAGKVQRLIWTPLLQKMRSLRLVTPRLVWTTPHVPGVIKPSDMAKATAQDLQSVTTYAKEMQVFLDGRGVPVLNTIRLTTGVMSHDGMHYALGVNKVSAAAVLHHVLELYWRNEW